MQPVGTGSQSDDGAADATPLWDFRLGHPNASTAAEAGRLHATAAS